MTKVSLLSMSAGGVTVSCDLGALERSAVATSAMQGGSGEDFVLFSLQGAASTNEVGKPKLPMVTALLDVPLDAVIELAVDQGEELSTSLAGLGIDLSQSRGII